jgi:hypothetical protein
MNLPPAIKETYQVLQDQGQTGHSIKEIVEVGSHPASNRLAVVGPPDPPTTLYQTRSSSCTTRNHILNDQVGDAEFHCGVHLVLESIHRLLPQLELSPGIAIHDELDKEATHSDVQAAIIPTHRQRHPAWAMPGCGNCSHVERCGAGGWALKPSAPPSPMFHFTYLAAPLLRERGVDPACPTLGEARVPCDVDSGCGTTSRRVTRDSALVRAPWSCCLGM